jgi:hypothetical protein
LRPGFHTSSGAAGRTKSSFLWRGRVRCVSQACSTSRSGGCWRTRGAHSLVTNFAFKWLQADKIDEINPDPQLFPEFDETLREAFRKELALFVGNVLGADGSIVDLLNSDVSFVNERLAVHYGINNVKGDQFRKVTLDERRRGLLGKGALLMASSYANRTSPVLRGAWVLETLIGTPPPAPPRGVEAFAESVAGARVQTVRQRLESHRANPSCNACHGCHGSIGIRVGEFRRHRPLARQGS